MPATKNLGTNCERSGLQFRNFFGRPRGTHVPNWSIGDAETAHLFYLTQTTIIRHQFMQQHHSDNRSYRHRVNIPHEC